MSRASDAAEIKDGLVRNLVRRGLACYASANRVAVQHDDWLELRPAEINTLRDFGSVEMVRSVWPPSRLRDMRCYYGRVGDVRRIAEDCKQIGTHTYIHRDHPAWDNGSEPVIAARYAPVESARFYTVICGVVRLYQPNRWMVQLKRTAKNQESMRIAHTPHTLHARQAIDLKGVR
jgi:hypothetical protein